MNLGSALLKRILEEQDLDTWANLKRHYLPSEHWQVYDAIDKHVDQYHSLPTLEALKIGGVREESLLQKIYAIEAIQVDAEAFLLLDYLKNEYTQKETLFQLNKYVDDTIAFETAEETIQSLYGIIARIEEKVDLLDPEENMQRISLFESDEEIADYIPLGLNDEFDKNVRFKSSDYILMGGKRGSGKSITCSNLADSIYRRGKSVLYFTIEMPVREILQRQSAIGAGVPHSRVKYKTLDNAEWVKVAQWWSNRYKNGEKHLADYRKHNDFNKFHLAIQKEELNDVQLDIIYDPSLTLPKLKAEVVKRTRKLGNVGLIIVDYVNQIKRSTNSDDKFDWKDQIHVSAALKEMAGNLGIPVFSPYQIDASGEARFAKGILDSADAAFILTPGPESIEFTCTKMRGDAKINFTSKVDWMTLTIGPENGQPVVEEESPNKRRKKVEELDDDTPIMDKITDLPW